MPIGDVEDLEELALELGCKLEELPTTYLDLPLGPPHNNVKVWNGVKERFRKQFNSLENAIYL